MKKTAKDIPAESENGTIPTVTAKKITVENAADGTNQLEKDQGDCNTSPQSTQEESIDAERQRGITKKLSTAQKNIGKIPEADRRGIEEDTFRHFKAGFSPKWRHSKSPKTIPTPRVIFPLGDGSVPAYNAVMTNSGRERFKNSDRWEFQKCLTDGGKFVFNPEALIKTSTVAVTEGEFDAVSIWQSIRKKLVCDERVGICALGGTCGATKDLIKRLNELDRKPRIIILFDGDDNHEDGKKPGRERAEDLRKALWDIGVVAVTGFFEDVLTDDEKASIGDKPDANKILTTKGNEFLYRVFSRIVKKALEDFKQASTEMEMWREHKQSANNSNDTAVQAASMKSNSQSKAENNPDIAALIDEINNTITPAMLEEKGYIRHSAKGNPRPEGYECFCGSGTHDKKTGGLGFTKTFPTLFFCRACGEGGNVIQFLAKVKGKENASGKEFIELLKEICDEFGISYDQKIFEYKPKTADRTTQTFIADCPLALEIPFGFSFSRHGIKKLIPKKNGEGFSETVVSRTPIIVTKRFVEKKSVNVEYELAFKTVYENKWIRKTFDAATIGDARQFTTLLNSGVSVQNHKLLAVYFDELINSPTNAKKIQSVTMHSQTGWTDETFTEFIYPSPDADYIVRRNGFDFHKELGTRGDAETWKKTFVDAMNYGGAVARIYSGFALAAPLVRPCNLPNLQSHLHAESGGGKTALEKLTASIFGNPKEMIRTFEATPKNRQAVAAAYNDLPTFLDELGTLSGKKADETLSQSIYAYSLGNQNQAQKINGDTRPLVKFYGARLSTGERAILKNHDPRGNFKRLPQLSCRNLLPDKFAAKLHVLSESNFGHFGRPWINFVIKHLKKICEQYQLFAAAFTQSDTYEATLVKSIVAAAVAYQFFMVCIGEQSEFDDAALDADISEILKVMPTVKEMSEDTRAIDALSSFVASHPKHFITEDKDNGAEIPAYATPTFGKRFRNGEVAFYPDQLEKILEVELRFSSCEAIVTALANAGKLITNTGRTRHRIPLDGGRVMAIHFAAGILSTGYTNKEDEDFITPPDI